MHFDVLTLFPHILDSYFSESMLKRAQAKKLIEIRTYNIRDYTTDKHHTTDDTPYGGGAGMVMKVEPIYRALKALNVKVQSSNAKSRSKLKVKKSKATRVILLAASGTPFTHGDAVRLAKCKRIVFICGRYEGVDERVKKFVDETISIGPYVLTGGELPAAIIVDAVSRHIPGVLGNKESAKDESFSDGASLEHPHYTKPEVFQKMRVPKVLLSGNHKKINEWRSAHKT